VMFGAMFDYARIAFNISTDNLVLVYPWVSGIGGLAAALLTAIIGATGAAPESTKAAPAKKGAPSKSASQNVPGMPSFDFDKARGEAAKPAATPDTGGSRPDAAAPAKPPQEQQK